MPDGDTQQERGFADRRGSPPHGYSLRRKDRADWENHERNGRKKSGPCGPAVEYLPSMWQALGLIPPYQKGKKKEGKPKTEESECWEDREVYALGSRGWSPRTDQKIPRASAKCLS